MCCIEGCLEKSVCRGYCRKHYDQAKSCGLLVVESYQRNEGNECSHFGCNRPARIKGYCTKHYQRFRKTGTTESSDISIIREMTISERLKYCSSINEITGCWNWKKHISNDGYGVISINNYPVRAHRASYSEFVREIPEGDHVLHKCDNRKCINPAQLFLGTNDDNMKDRNEKGRTCKGEDRSNSKLTEDQVREIKRKFANGEDYKKFYKDYPVSGKCLRNIRDGKAWKHVTI